MIWLYRLQQRLSITRQEGLAILTLTGLFLLGLTVRHVQEQQVPPLSADSLVARSPATPADSMDEKPNGNEASTPTADDPINLNTASHDALQALPGVGPVLAKRIDAYRSTQRPFQRVEELKRVSGIGPETLATLRPMVRVAPPDESPE